MKAWMNQIILSGFVVRKKNVSIPNTNIPPPYAETIRVFSSEDNQNYLIFKKWAPLRRPKPGTANYRITQFDLTYASAGHKDK